MKIDPSLEARTKAVKNAILTDRLLSKDSGCPLCLIPKNICNKFSKEYNLTNGKCYLEDYLYKVIAIFSHFKETLETLPDFTFLTLEPRAVLRHLISPITLGTLKTIKMIELLLILRVDKLIQDLSKAYNPEDSISSGSEDEEISPLEQINISNSRDNIPDVPNSFDSLPPTNDIDKYYDDLVVIDQDIPNPLTPEVLSDSPPSPPKGTTETTIEVTPDLSNLGLRATFEWHKKQALSNNSLARDSTESNARTSRKHTKNLSLDVAESSKRGESSKRLRAEGDPWMF